MYLLFAEANVCITWEIPPLIPLSNDYTMSISVSSSNSTLVIFKQASKVNPGVVQKYPGSNLYSFKHNVLNYSNVFANWEVSDWT